jgi:hypothetical protein
MDSLVTPLAQSLDKFADRKTADRQQLQGKSLPCSVVSTNGAIVTVKFEVNAAPFTLPNVTVPIFGPEYVRHPIKAGDKGFVMTASVSLRGVSGLGSGVADLSRPGNLTALVFMPVGNTNFPPLDPTKWWAYATANCRLSLGDTGARFSGSHADVVVDQSLKVTTAATGTFTSADGKTVTVVAGIVTEIV